MPDRNILNNRVDAELNYFFDYDSWIDNNNLNGYEKNKADASKKREKEFHLKGKCYDDDQLVRK